VRNLDSSGSKWSDDRGGSALSGSAPRMWLRLACASALAFVSGCTDPDATGDASTGRDAASAHGDGGGTERDASTAQEDDAGRDAGPVLDASAGDDAAIATDAPSGPVGSCAAPIELTRDPEAGITMIAEPRLGGPELECVRPSIARGEPTWEAFFTFELTETQDLTFELARPLLQEIGFVIVPSCDGGTLACGGGDRLAAGPWIDELPRIPPGRYLMTVHSDDPNLDFVVAASPPAPRNDACEDALPIPYGVTQMGTFVGHGFGDDFHGCGPHENQPDMFFTLDLPEDTTVMISAFTTEGGDITVLSECGGVVEACSRDAPLHLINTPLSAGRHIVAVDYVPSAYFHGAVRIMANESP
jgi:hypothetical protein